MCAQTIHAAGESANLWSILNPGQKLPQNTHAVCLAVEGEDHLLNLSVLLTNYDIRHCLILEPDDPYVGEATAIGIPPQTRERLKSILRHLPLIK